MCWRHGLRVSELVGLRWEHVEWKTARLRCIAPRAQPTGFHSLATWGRWRRRRTGDALNALQRRRSRASGGSPPMAASPPYRHAPVALCGVGCRSRRAVRLGGARRLQDRSSASSEIDLTEIVAGERGEEHSAIRRCGEASLDVQEVARVKGVAAQDPQGRHRKRDPRRLHKPRPPARRRAPRWGQLALLQPARTARGIGP